MTRAIVLFTITVLLVDPCFGQVVSYDANSFPDDATPTWERIDFCTPTRSIANGALTIDVEIGECGPPARAMGYDPAAPAGAYPPSMRY